MELPEHDAEVIGDLESHLAPSPGKVTSTHDDVSISTQEVLEVENKVVNPANLADEHPDSSTSIHASFSTNTAVNQTTLLNLLQAETTSSSEQSTLELVLDAIWISFES